jgi:type IV secretion system protein VirB9
MTLIRRLMINLALSVPLVAGLAAAPASAQTSGAASSGVPRPSPGDPRIRTVLYSPNEVVELRGHFGYQMLIEFAEDERIENVSIGDSLAWQVTPNRRANLLFLKPIERDIATNMTVVTNLRRYAFELTARAASSPMDPTIIYTVRFQYPQDAPKVLEIAPPAGAPPAADQLNFGYSFEGSKAILPARVFDDGRQTFFQWPDQTPTPAVFALGADGKESVVNFSVRNGYLVVSQTGPAFVLRHGAQRTVVHNDAFRSPTPGPQAPRERERGGLFSRGGQ